VWAHAAGEVDSVQEPELAVAVVGREQPAWLAGLRADTALVEPSAVEPGLNALLARTTAPVFLAVQPDDQMKPEALRKLARTLQSASAAVAGATGDAAYLRSNGESRRVGALYLSAPAPNLARLALPHPVLFRTEALRAAGGWQPGEAEWPRRTHRHRRLLARLLETGRRLIAVRAFLGCSAPYTRAVHTPDLHAQLQQLLYQSVTVLAGRHTASGRVAAVTPDLLTLARPDGQLLLVPVDRIQAVRTEPPAKPPPPGPAPPPVSWP
jgi:hypothetical protein